MTLIAVTGAAGQIGRQALEALSDDDVRAITYRQHDAIDSVVADVTDYSSFESAIEGADVLVHLAANPDSSASWDAVLDTNIHGTYNAFEAARSVGVDRVVFASSNHTTAMYNIASVDERGTMVEEEQTVVTPDTPPRPDGYYGVSKVAGEALGCYYADRFGIDVVNFRIGWLLDRDQLRETQNRSPDRARFARALWLSPRDCREAVRCAVHTDLTENPLTVHVVSRNSDRYVTLTPTMRELGYRPQDDSSEVLADSSTDSTS